jgi:hypothetical protein
MDSQFTELLSTIRDINRRLGILESHNQVRTIKDDSGNTIIDTSGLNSLSNFKQAQAFNGAAGLSTTSTSFVDVAGSSLTSLVFPRTTNVLVYMMSYGLNGNAISSDLSDKLEVRLYDSFINDSLANTITCGSCATNVVPDGMGGLDITQSVSEEMVYEMAVLQMAAGTHNLKLQYKASGGGTAYLVAWLAGYIVLGS